MFFAPLFLLAALVMVLWFAAQLPQLASIASPLAIARQRLAAGEITESEFREIERTLGVAAAVSPTPTFVMLAVLLGAGLLLASSVWMMAWTARGGDWDWGTSHIGRMMRWDRSPSGSTLQTDAAEVSVQIRDFAYAPQTLEVRVGAKVTWTNEDAVPHSATDRGARWDTGTMGKGASKQVSFDTSGTFGYYCTVHPSMSGTVVVRP